MLLQAGRTLRSMVLMDYEHHNGNMKQSTIGFTIVELLIVIVVIAILASVSVVAYTGIQNRASDSAVKSDLRNLAMIIQQKYAVTGEYPSGGGNDGTLSDITFQPAKSSYQKDINNLYYCAITTGANARFAVAGVSRSGERIAYYSGTFQPYSGTWSSNGNICPNLGIPTTEAGYSWAFGQGTNNSWNAWTN